MQLVPEADPSARPAAFGLMRGVAAVVMALAFVGWALVSAAKVPCRCDESLTVRGAAMPWLSMGVALVSLATFLLLRTEARGSLPKVATMAGCMGIIAAYVAFLGRHFGYAGQMTLAGISALVFTAGVTAMIWKGASRRMALSFGIAVGLSVVVVILMIWFHPSS